MELDIEAKNKRNQASGDIELPEWAGRIVRFVYLGFGLFLLASSLMLLGCSSADASTGFDWQAATNVLSEARALAVVAENSSTSDEEAASILASMQVYQSDEGLLVVDFNSPLLTGRAGGRFQGFGGRWCRKVGTG